MNSIGIIDWEPPRGVYEHYINTSTIDLLNLYDASTDEDGTILMRYDYENAPIEIASRLNLIPTDLANEGVTEKFRELLDRIDKLEKAFKQHRHQIDKPYSEKPAW